MTIRETPSPSWRAIEKPPAGGAGADGAARAVAGRGGSETLGAAVDERGGGVRACASAAAADGPPSGSRSGHTESTSRLASAFTEASSSAVEPPGTETGRIRFQSERKTRPVSGGFTVSRTVARRIAASVTGRGGGDGRKADEATVAAGAALAGA